MVKVEEEARAEGVVVDVEFDQILANLRQNSTDASSAYSESFLFPFLLFVWCTQKINRKTKAAATAAKAGWSWAWAKTDPRLDTQSINGVVTKFIYIFCCAT